DGHPLARRDWAGGGAHARRGGRPVAELRGRLPIRVGRRAFGDDAERGVGAGGSATRVGARQRGAVFIEISAQNRTAKHCRNTRGGMRAEAETGRTGERENGRFGGLPLPSRTLIASLWPLGGAQRGVQSAKAHLCVSRPQITPVLPFSLFLGGPGD